MFCYNRFKTWRFNTSRLRTNANVCKLLYKEMRNEGDNSPIGIVLCADKSDQIVKYTLPEENNQIFASKYKLYLPTGRRI